MNSTDRRQDIENDNSLDRIVKFQNDHIEGLKQEVENYRRQANQEQFVKNFIREINDPKAGLERRVSTIIDSLYHRFGASEAFLYFSHQDELQDSINMNAPDLTGFIQAPSFQELLEGKTDEIIQTIKKKITKAIFRLEIPNEENKKEIKGGILYLGNKQDGTHYTMEEVELIRGELLADINNSLINSLNSEDKDSLTNLPNRKAFDVQYHTNLANALRTNRDLAVIMIDLDNFKSKNDIYGHQAGDYILRAAADVIKAANRQGDITARYGGEEFVKLLPNADAKGAHEVARRVLEGLRNVELPFFYEKMLAKAENKIISHDEYHSRKTKGLETELASLTPKNYEQYKDKLVKVEISKAKYNELMKNWKGEEKTPYGREELTATMGICTYPTLTPQLQLALTDTVDNYAKNEEPNEKIKNPKSLVNHAIVDHLFSHSFTLVEKYFATNKKTRIMAKEMKDKDHFDFLGWAIMKFADDALYKGKEAGRDRIVMYD